MKFFSITDIGKKRKENEDSFASKIYEKAKENIGFFIMADGMGGYKNGAYASNVATQVVKIGLEEFLEEFFKNGETIDFSKLNIEMTNEIDFKSVRLKQLKKEEPKEKIGNNNVYDIFKRKIKALIDRANVDIYKFSLENSPLGTTLIVLLVINNKIIVGNIGDSRVYSFKNKKLFQITKDNSYVQQLIDSNKIKKEEARNYKFKNQITKAVGFEPYVNTDFYEKEIEKDELLLICTDGLTTMVDDEKIEDILKLDESIEDKVKLLLNEANENGGNDNITITLVRI